MNPHYYEIFSNGQKFIAATHGGMAQVLLYPTPDAPADSEKTIAMEGTARAYMAWVCRLICANKKNDFTFKQLHATGPTSPAAVNPPSLLPLPSSPPIHIEAPIDSTTGAVATDQALNLDTPPNGTYTIIIRTPGGPPSKEVRDSLKGHRLYWNPNDSRGNSDYPSPAWLRHHVPGPELEGYRQLANSLKVEFDYLDRNPVK